MDVKLPPALYFLIRFSKIRFSIRLSILAIVLILLIGISILIIGINYFVLNSILVTSAKNASLQSSGMVAEKIRGYLQPLNRNVAIAHQMFVTQVINPKNPEFIRFLSNLIVGDKNLSGVYWADEEGNLYWVNKNKDRGLFQEVVLHDRNGIKIKKKILDEQGRVLSIENLASEIDSRLRPWYQQAKLSKSLVWVVYRFIQAGYSGTSTWSYFSVSHL